MSKMCFLKHCSWEWLQMDLAFIFYTSRKKNALFVKNYSRANDTFAIFDPKGLRYGVWSINFIELQLKNIDMSTKHTLIKFIALSKENDCAEKVFNHLIASSLFLLGWVHIEDRWADETPKLSIY